MHLHGTIVGICPPPPLNGHQPTLSLSPSLCVANGVLPRCCWSAAYTDKKEKKSFLTYMEIQKGAVAKSYMTNGLLISD